MSKIGHNKPPIALDPKETIKKNINRRKLIVDDGISLFKGVPLPTWIELSLIDVFALNQMIKWLQILTRKCLKT